MKNDYESFNEKENGKYWPNALSIQQIADKIGLDSEKYQTCLDSGKYSNQVKQDILEAKRLGITAAPAFVINGQLLTGAKPIQEFEKLLKKSKS